MPLVITPMPGGTGAEATGVDLRQPVSPDLQTRLNEALLEHVALVIRDQHLTPGQYLDAMRIFGEPQPQQYGSKFALPELPTVQIVSNQHRQSDGRPVYHGRIWHSDHTHEPVPPNYTVLYALEVPSKGGATCIANTRQAYNSLDPVEQSRLDRMKVVTALTQGRAALAESTKAELLAKNERANLGATHPLVRTHPDNGSKAVYFHAIKTDHIDGMTPAESKRLLAELLDRITADRFVYRHRWRVGDVLIWDNRSAMHQASFDYDSSEHRLLHRLILKGEAPFGPAMPRNVA